MVDASRATSLNAFPFESSKDVQFKFHLIQSVNASSDLSVWKYIYSVRIIVVKVSTHCSLKFRSWLE